METGERRAKAEELNSMGLTFIQSAQEAEALKYFNRAIEQDGDYLEPYYNKAMVYQIAGKYEEALECYNLLLQKDSRQGEACYQKANLMLFYKEDVKEAIELYNKAIFFGEKTEEAYFNLGLCMEVSGMGEEALKWVNRAINRNAKKPDYHLKKAGILTGLKRYNEAIAAYDQVLMLRADSEEAHHFKAILLAETKKNEASLQALDEAEKVLGPRVLFEYDRALVLESLGKYEEALSHIEKGLEMDADNTMLIVKKGALLSLGGNLEGAKNVFDQVSELEPENAEGYFNKANVDMLLEDYGTAQELFDTIIRKCDDEDPYKINAHYFKAWCLKKSGETEAAEEAYKAALKVYNTLSLTYPYDAQLMLLKANTLRDLQRYEEADELYEYVLDIDKSMADAHLMRAKNDLCTGRISEARKRIETAIAINPAYTNVVNLDPELKGVLTGS